MSASAPRANPGNPWDTLSDYFDTAKNADEIPAGAADNILIAWPVVFGFLDRAAPEAAGKRALDVGCGTGGFAHALQRRGYDVTGIDPSPAMIERARVAYGAEVDFRVGDASLLRDLPPFALITSILALQFVAEVEATMGELATALEPGGHLVFAVHNPECVQSGMLHFSVGVEVPIYVRTAEEYHALARSAGLVPVLEAEPPFTAEFVARYPGYAGQPPEYLILGYAKR